MVELGDEKLFRIESGGTPNTQKKEYWGGDINWATLVDLPAANYITELTATKRKITTEGLKNSSAKVLPKNSILISSRATIGRIAINKNETATNQGFKNLIIRNKEKISVYFIALCISKITDKLEAMGEGSTYKEFSKSDLASIKIPLPPLDIQERIVAEIEQYQNIINGARQIMANWHPTIKIDPAWPLVALGEVCEVLRGTSITKKNITDGNIPVIAGGKQPAYYHNQANRKGEIITVSGSGAYAGFVNFFQTPIFASDCSTIKPLDENKLHISFVFYVLRARQNDLYKLQSGMGQPHVYPKELKKLTIPLPPLEVQQQIVDAIEVKQRAIEAARDLIKSLERERDAILVNRLES